MDFSIPTSSGDAGDYSLEVSSSDTSDSTSVTVEEQSDPANFDVSIDGTNSPVTEGNTLTVDVTVTNTGDKSDTQTIDATVSGGKVDSDSKSVRLTGGSSEPISFSIPTGIGDAGSYDLIVRSDDKFTSTQITIEEQPDPANFDVTIDNTNSPITEGETLIVDATVTNTGDKSATQTIQLDAGSLGDDSESVFLNGGQQKSVTLSVPTGSGDAESYTAKVSSKVATTIVSPELYPSTKTRRLRTLT